MSLSVYQVAVPTTVKILTNLLAILDKAEAHCEAKNIDPAVLLNLRLYPNMFPLIRQVQITTDQAKGMAARLTGSPVPSYPDTEQTFEELKARIAKTIAFVESHAPESFEGAELREIVLKFGTNEMKFEGGDYLVGFYLPNFYFHVTAAYAILRHNGVEIGKRDFV
jgi:hypothetical protein